MELANSIITLQPGIYILRHPQTGMPPISISRAAGKLEHNGSIQALYTPNTDGGILRDGRDCIVMQVLNASVDLLVTAYLEKVGVAVPSLKIDKIALDGDAAAAAGKPLEIPPKGISIIGHIERVGDSVATEGQRLGEPASNLRLEGFQVMWPDKPNGIELQYGARAEGASAATVVRTGGFCGTRNAAKRLIEVSFDLIGPEAHKYQVGGVAHFSGGFSFPIERGVRLAGPTGVEHLTALTLAISLPERAKASKNPWAPSQRTRILKAPAKARK